MIDVLFFGRVTGEKVSVGHGGSLAALLDPDCDDNIDGCVCDTCKANKMAFIFPNTGSLGLECTHAGLRPEARCHFTLGPV